MCELCPKLWKNSPCVHVVYQVLRENLVTNANDRKPGKICRAGQISFWPQDSKSTNLCGDKINKFESNWLLWIFMWKSTHTPGQENIPSCSWALVSRQSRVLLDLTSKRLEHYCVYVCECVFVYCCLTVVGESSLSVAERPKCWCMFIVLHI